MPTKWKVFIIAKRDGDKDYSALRGDRTMQFINNQFIFDGTPAIPPLSLSEGVWRGSDSDYTYTWTIHKPNPSSSQFFLGQITGGPINGTADRYDTTLAIDTSILTGTMSNHDDDLTLYTPAQRWLKNDYPGKIVRTKPKGEGFFRVTTTKQELVHFPIYTDQTVFPNSFWNNGHVATGELRRLGGRYIDKIITSAGTSHVIFGHFHWGTDLVKAGDKDHFGLYGLGDKTEPFVGVTSPPPPPIDCDDPS